MSLCIHFSTTFFLFMINFYCLFSVILVCNSRYFVWHDIFKKYICELQDVKPGFGLKKDFRRVFKQNKT